MGQPSVSFSFKLSFQIHITIFTSKNVKNVHPVYGAGTWTHNLWNTSLLPKPLDQGSRPSTLHVCLPDGSKAWSHRSCPPIASLGCECKPESLWWAFSSSLRRLVDLEPGTNTKKNYFALIELLKITARFWCIILGTKWVCICDFALSRWKCHNP